MFEKFLENLKHFLRIWEFPKIEFYLSRKFENLGHCQKNFSRREKRDPISRYLEMRILEQNLYQRYGLRRFSRAPQNRSTNFKSRKTNINYLLLYCAIFLADGVEHLKFCSLICFCFNPSSAIILEMSVLKQVAQSLCSVWKKEHRIFKFSLGFYSVILMV